MSIPANARVRAVPHFLACLRSAYAFMQQQEAACAPARFKRLQSEVAKARKLIAFEPASGRPARFLDARSAWGRYQAAEAMRLAQELAMPHLRELVLVRHVVLYAHHAQEAALLALRHERQSTYVWPGGSHHLDR